MQTVGRTQIRPRSRSKLFTILMLFLKECFEGVNFERNTTKKTHKKTQQTDDDEKTKHAKLPSMKRVSANDINEPQHEISMTSLSVDSDEPVQPLFKLRNSK